MAVRAALLLTLAALSASTSALQVTPNSPCAALCIDPSDPNSSSTRGGDIVCEDAPLRSTPRGQKFQRCLGCLQGSAFAQGGESDQAWFLYNLRYAFDYCVLGYPNATGVGSNPCMTSEACGRLGGALEHGIKDPSGAEQFAYCAVDGGVVLGSYNDGCLQCVQADGSHAYLSNFLIALEAGCKQKPAPGLLLGLNATVFSNTTIQITQPSSSPAGSGSSSSPSTPLSTPAIAAIAIGGLVALALAAACVFVQLRKRRNRAARASALLFRCKTPRTGTFVTQRGEDRDNEYDEGRFFDEKTPDVDHAAASPGGSATTGLWNAQSGTSGLGIRENKPASIVTTLSAPAPAHTSPRWVPADDYTTPMSTTSTRSTAALLSRSPYIPSSSPGMMSSPLSTGSPPVTNQSRFRPDGQEVGLARELVRQQRWNSAGAPVQIATIQTSFAPPPKR
ncbi:hypothetical protein TOPH_01832 [Tolypocladium ophioglossoides CBS 100239]|uniref:LPXTG-domain-containing protein n=1 Tax=Tolypocladium ophioglossoides (strain CBS 100239) TaxID=1163406 RepID=A0A0L0NII8_TOLOC|nr:hypothetical protein TOPH_01832 [Tolypocladium ophioglossoides CBS 100239]